MSSCPASNPAPSVQFALKGQLCEMFFFHSNPSRMGTDCRVADPHWFNADPDTDPDPAFFLIADPDSGFRIPDPDPGFDDLKLKKNLIFSFWSTIAIYLSLGLHKRRPSYKRSLQPSKENIQHFKTWKFWTFFYFCGSFLPSWIRIRIRNLNADQDPDPATPINADPQPWYSIGLDFFW